MAALALWSLACGSRPLTGSAHVSIGVPASRALTVGAVTVTLTGVNAPGYTVTRTLPSQNGLYAATFADLPAGPYNFSATATYTDDASAQHTLAGETDGVPVVAGQTALVVLVLQENGTTYDNDTPIIDSLTASTAQPTPGARVDFTVVAHDVKYPTGLKYAWTSTDSVSGAPAGSFADGPGNAANTSTSSTPVWTASTTVGQVVAISVTVTNSQGQAASASFTVTIAGAQGSAHVTVYLDFSPLIVHLVSNVAWLDAADPQRRAITLSANALASSASPALSGTWMLVDTGAGGGVAATTQQGGATIASSHCAGSFGSAQLTGTAPSFSLAAAFSATAWDPAICVFQLKVADDPSAQGSGAGVYSNASTANRATATGTLRLAGKPPSPEFGPQIDQAVSSGTTVVPGDQLTFTVAAHDPGATALVFTWTAGKGTLGTASSSAGESTITWTSPQCLSTSALITATVTNGFGLAAHQGFNITPAAGSACVLSGPGVWTASASTLSKPRTTSLLAALPDGRVLVAGPDNTAEIYNPVTDSFAATQNNMSAARDSSSILATLNDGRLLIAGGYGAPGTAELFDPSTNSFSSAGTMVKQRVLFSAVTLNSGKVLLVAGYTPGASRITDVEVFDPSNSSFTAVAPIPIARSTFSATLLSDGRVLAAGGFGNQGLVTTGAVYDPVHDTWTTTGAMVAPRALQAAQLLANGRVFLVGGDNLNNTLDSAEIYDPDANTFSAVASHMSFPRRNFGAITLASGKILVVAGYKDSFSGTALTTTCDLFDPVTSTFSPTGAVHTQRLNFSIAPLPNGRVLIAGGEGGAAPLNTAEIYY